MNIAETFVNTAQKMVGRTAVIEASTGREISFSDLNRQSDSYARFLTESGVKAGERVILMVSPSIEFLSLAIALFKVGATIILIDPGMGFKNLLRCIKRVAPKVLIGIPKAVAFAKLFPNAFQTVDRYFCCGRSYLILGEDIRKYSEIDSGPFPVYRPARDDLAAIIFTTGSTGPPKGVRYEHSIFTAQLDQIIKYYKITPNDIDQPAFPLFALFATAIGACAVIPDMDPTKPAKVDPEKFIDSIKKYGVTYSFGSPAIWNVVGKYCEKTETSLDSISKILMAGAPVPYDLLARIRRFLPENAEIFTPYGATESLPVTSIESREILNETWHFSRTGKGTCVGRPLPDTAVKILRISDEPIDSLEEEMVLKTGEIGEIIVQGNVVTRAYENNALETRLAKITDKKSNTFWHRMGDIGYLDDKGRLWFCGRRAHRVVTESETLFSIPCESIINEHPLVFRSALVGIPATPQSNSRKKIAVIIVEPQKDAKINERKLLDEIKILAAQSNVTRSISHFLVHRDFPVDIRHNAKIFREKLAVWAEKKIVTC